MEQVIFFHHEQAWKFPFAALKNLRHDIQQIRMPVPSDHDSTDLKTICESGCTAV